jgi:beta-galactosidase
MKQHNIKAVRTSHYPNQTAWYDLSVNALHYTTDDLQSAEHLARQALP